MSPVPAHTHRSVGALKAALLELIAGKVSKAGDTMTGPLVLQPVTGPAQIVMHESDRSFTLKTAGAPISARFYNAAGDGYIPVRVATPTASDDAATKGYVDNLNNGQKWVSGTAVLVGAPTSDYNVPGLSSVVAFMAVNGDVQANSGQVVAVIPNAAGPGTVTMHHTFNGGAFRIYFMACGTP